MSLTAPSRLTHATNIYDTYILIDSTRSDYRTNSNNTYIFRIIPFGSSSSINAIYVNRILSNVMEITVGEFYMKIAAKSQSILMNNPTISDYFLLNGEYIPSNLSNPNIPSLYQTEDAPSNDNENVTLMLEIKDIKRQNFIIDALSTYTFIFNAVYDSSIGKYKCTPVFDKIILSNPITHMDQLVIALYRNGTIFTNNDVFVSIQILLVASPNPSTSDTVEMCFYLPNHGLIGGDVINIQNFNINLSQFITPVILKYGYAIDYSKISSYINSSKFYVSGAYTTTDYIFMNPTMPVSWYDVTLQNISNMENIILPIGTCDLFIDKNKFIIPMKIRGISNLQTNPIVPV